MSCFSEWLKRWYCLGLQNLVASNLFVMFHRKYEPWEFNIEMHIAQYKTMHIYPKEIQFYFRIADDCFEAFWERFLGGNEEHKIYFKLYKILFNTNQFQQTKSCVNDQEMQTYKNLLN